MGDAAFLLRRETEIYCGVQKSRTLDENSVYQLESLSGLCLLYLADVQLITSGVEWQ
jgi:hypothetical protein